MTITIISKSTFKITMIFKVKTDYCYRENEYIWKTLISTIKKKTHKKLRWEEQENRRRWPNALVFSIKIQNELELTLGIWNILISTIKIKNALKFLIWAGGGGEIKNIYFNDKHIYIYIYIYIIYVRSPTLWSPIN